MPPKVKSISSSIKRSYSRLHPEQWSEITDLFLSGGLSLSELSARYGVSTRAIQIHVARVRAAASAASSTEAFAAIGKTATSTAAMLTKANHEICIEQTRASAYSDAVALQTLIGQSLVALADNPAVPPTARLRACDQAAVALERTHKLRRMILGMSKEADVADQPLPELPIRMLTDQEVRAMRELQAMEDEGTFMPDDEEEAGIMTPYESDADIIEE